MVADCIDEWWLGSIAIIAGETPFDLYDPAAHR
jgi:hypothetical protein